MKPRSALIFVVLFWSALLHAATYNIPPMAGTPFSACTLSSGTTYNCSGSVTIGNNHTINVASSMTINVSGSFTLGTGTDIIVASGQTLNIIAVGTIDLGNNSVNNTNFTSTTGSINMGTGSVTNGNLSSPNGTVNLGNNTTVNGNVFGAAINTGTGAVVNGSCSPPDSQCSGRNVSIGAATIVEGNSGSSNAAFTVTLSSSYTSNVTFNYATSNVTATGGASCAAGVDYVTTSGSKTIPAGSTTTTITVQVCGDTVKEPTETFNVTLSSPSNAALGSPSFNTGTIANDDPLADYHFDECSYNGTSGEVADSLGSYPATSSGAIPTTQATGVVGRSLDLNALNKYVRPNSKVPLPGDYTLSFWMKTPLPAPAGNAIYATSSLASDGGVCRGDFMNIRSDFSYRWRVYQQSIGGANGTYSISGLSAGWHHFAVTGAGSTSTLYVDGVNRGTVPRRANADRTTLGLGYIGASCDDPSGQALRTPIDEFIVFDSVLEPSSIINIYNNQSSGKNYDGSVRTVTSCSTVNHYAITYPNGAAGSTCTPLVVRVTAHDTSHASVNPSASKTITLSATPAATSWALKTGAGTFNSSTNQYTFSGTENYAEFLMTQPAVTPSINVNVTDGTTTEAAGEDPAGSVSASAFSFVDASGNPVTIGTQIAGKQSSVSPGMTLQLDAGASCAADGLTGSQVVDVAYECMSPATCVNSNLLTVFPASGSTVIQRNNAGASLSYTPVTLTFDASGHAPFSFRYDDAGEIKLSFKKDGASGSATFVVRPFGLYLSVAGNPANSTTGGAVFREAGADFTGAVAGVLWQAADDANADGVPDSSADLSNNGTTPNYAWNTTLAANTPIAPAAGTLGALQDSGAAPVTLAQASFSGGSANSSTLQYTEVGSFTLKASASDYINSGIGITGNGVVVGRFKPYQFAIVTDSLDHGCPAGSFTYSRQPLSGAVVIQAQNKTGGRTANYRDGYDKLTVGGITFINSTTGLPFDSLSASIDPLNTFSNYQNGTSSNTGQASININYLWNMPLQVPTVSSMSITAINDGEVSRLTTTPIDPAAINPTTYRYGRLWLGNAHGSDRIDLDIPFETQYWNGSAFVKNTSDICTTLASGNIGFGNQQGLAGYTPSASSIIYSGGPGGSGRITLAHPTGVAGSVDLVANLGSSGSPSNCSGLTGGTSAGLAYLSGRWCGSNYDRDPTARATFGIFGKKGPIYLRENY